jgi:hypothetical protein
MFNAELVQYIERGGRGGKNIVRLKKIINLRLKKHKSYNII